MQQITFEKIVAKGEIVFLHLPHCFQLFHTLTHTFIDISYFDIGVFSLLLQICCLLERVKGKWTFSHIEKERVRIFIYMSEILFNSAKLIGS